MDPTTVMAHSKQAGEEREENYRRARDTFNHMNPEDQATFLVEATASLLARGVKEAGRVVAEGLDELFRPARSSSRSSSNGPGPAEPETAQQRAPRGGASDPPSD